ncbi:hypothetical protein [Roseomonas fluvialis]|uniref:DUF4239 domain-containing protein n=1 Tax=Roseomonas fluvialis TaxID=1750527 RepID=A0ABN6P2P3_9PROT|nr:hypothetical protein [Roseomonas fluvialis]BDG72913.1 hypothetical protein Rmf_28420 [Roseomonas fluvialis]
MVTEAIQELAAFSVFAFAAALFLIQAAAKEIGYVFGHRRAAHQENPGEGVSVVVGGMLGLLAFVLALTLSFSSARFQERREGTLAEANAIGTAWLQAQAIGHPRGAEIARLLEEYTHVRRDFVAAGRFAPEVETATRRTNALQSVIWGHLAAIVRERPDPVTSSLMNALNTTFDLATAERFAFATLFPPQLFWLLIGMTMVSMAALGFQLGLRQKPLRVLSFLLLSMWTATMTIILDMGAARLGSIRIGVQAYDWTIQGFHGGVTVPPAPAR